MDGSRSTPSPLLISRRESFLTHSTIFPTAYGYALPGTASPSASSFLGYSMSAEKNTSKGAPFSISERKFPDDPVLTRSVQPAAFSKFAVISFIANIRSAAAATVTVPHGFGAACGAEVESAALVVKGWGRISADDASAASPANNMM